MTNNFLLSFEVLPGQTRHSFSLSTKTTTCVRGEPQGLPTVAKTRNEKLGQPTKMKYLEYFSPFRNRINYIPVKNRHNRIAKRLPCLFHKVYTTSNFILYCLCVHVPVENKTHRRKRPVFRIACLCHPSLAGNLEPTGVAPTRTTSTKILSTTLGPSCMCSSS